MASYSNPIRISGTVSWNAGALTALLPSDTLLAAQLLTNSLSRPGIAAWAAGLSATVDEVYSYAGNLYQVIQAHTTQSDWTPDVALSLFMVYRAPDSIPAWVQPVGSFDAYALGFEVTHNGHTWKSTIGANVWEPGSTGAGSLWTQLA